MIELTGFANVGEKWNVTLNDETFFYAVVAGTNVLGKIAQGLDIALSGDVSDEEVADVFQADNFPNRSDKWDALEEWVQRLV